MESVELMGGPAFGICEDGRLEAVLPTSHFESAWRSAFRDALPKREHTWRISAHEDTISIVFDDERQLAQYMQIALDAIAVANRELEALEARLRELTSGSENDAAQRASH